MDEFSIFVDNYLNRGFGSMNKNDFEVMIFYYLLQKKFQNKSNYDISIELRIPESKIRRLRYEAELKYGSTDTNLYANKFERLLAKSILKKNGSCVLFNVEDVQLRKYLDSILKKGGRFSDTSFNSEIISIDIDDLEFLLKTIWPDNWKEIEIKAREKKNSNSVSLRDLVKVFWDSAANEAGKLVVNLTYKGLLGLL